MSIVAELLETLRKKARNQFGEEFARDLINSIRAVYLIDHGRAVSSVDGGPDGICEYLNTKMRESFAMSVETADFNIGGYHTEIIEFEDLDGNVRTYTFENVPAGTDIIQMVIAALRVIANDPRDIEKAVEPIKLRGETMRMELQNRIADLHGELIAEDSKMYPDYQIARQLRGF